MSLARKSGPNPKFVKAVQPERLCRNIVEVEQLSLDESKTDKVKDGDIEDRDCAKVICSGVFRGVGGLHLPPFS